MIQTIGVHRDLLLARSNGDSRLLSTFGTKTLTKDGHSVSAPAPSVGKSMTVHGRRALNRPESARASTITRLILSHSNCILNRDMYCK
jgi:hypothetical protein